MNDIEAKALALLKTQHCPNCETTEQKLSAFKQEVSDAVGYVIKFLGARHWAETHLKDFIIPAPKPDPLVEAIEKCAAQMHLTSEDAAKELRAALDARGLEIREKK
jgi:hypothetical protein